MKDLALNINFTPTSPRGKPTQEEWLLTKVLCNAIAFFVDNEIAIPNAELAVRITQQKERGWHLWFNQADEKELFMDIGYFEERGELLDWIADFDTSKDLINNQIKQNLITQLVELNASIDLPESWSPDIQALRKDYEKFQAVIDDADKDIPVVTKTSGFFIDGEFITYEEKEWSYGYVIALPGNPEPFYEDWVFAGRPSAEDLRNLDKKLREEHPEWDWS